MINISLELTADVELNGLPAAVIEKNLRSMIDRAIGEGLITGYTEAEVDSYSVDVTIDRHHLEDEIARWLSTQIEDGNLDLETMGQRLARYGLQMPSDFIAEIRERADLATE